MAGAKSQSRDDWLAHTMTRLSFERGKRRNRPSKKPTLPHKRAAVDLGRVAVLENPVAAWNEPGCPTWQDRRVDESPALGQTRSQSAARVPEQRPDRTPPEVSGRDGHEPAPDVILGGVEQLGRRLESDVLAQLRRQYHEQTHKGGGDLEVALADHFWCGVLAGLSYAMAEGIRLVEKLPDRFIDLIRDSRADDGRIWVSDVVLRTAVRTVWVNLSSLTPVEPRSILLVTRLLAVMMCKAPERHKAVATHCLDPLAKSLRRETRHYLVEALGDWLPRTTASLRPVGVRPAG